MIMLLHVVKLIICSKSLSSAARNKPTIASEEKKRSKFIVFFDSYMCMQIDADAHKLNDALKNLKLHF